MTLKIAWTRLQCQRLAGARLARPAEVVAWLGAVQAQEYPLAKWGLGLRLRRATDAAVERAFAAGTILRTHVLRPTWHFVTPADIRWMLALTAPRVRAILAHYDRDLGITPAIVARANRTIASALAGGAQLTRAELKVALTRAKIPVESAQRLARVVMHAELDGLICSGPRRGSQFTYALLDDRAPAVRVPPREEALAELARRYFTSRGPAQLKDFGWWSGLTLADARAGVELAGPHLANDEIDGRRYWFTTSIPTSERPARAAWLLPPYDEYLIAYKDRSAALGSATWKPGAWRDPPPAPIVLDGRVVGGWSATAGPGTVAIVLHPLQRLSRADALLVDEAAHRYGDFLGLDVTISRR